MPPNTNDTRLDAVENVFFRRQLESIDARVYEQKYAQHKAQALIPQQSGVNPNARSYTYRMTNGVGKARPIGNASDDLPKANATGVEITQRIQNIGASYDYDVFEIKAAAMTGTQLDDMRARNARKAVEELIDEYLSLGNASLGLKGLLTLSGTSTYSPSGFWGDLDSADPDNVAGDLLGLGSKCAEATDEAFSRVTIALPLPMYNIAAQLKMSTTSDITVLKFVMATSPYIEGVVPWYRTEANALWSASHNRVVAFPRDPEVVSALVPNPLETMAPEQRNLSFVINMIASVGGVVCRHPKAITYMDVPTS